MVKLKNNDFIEIDFTARIREGSLFDTTIEAEARKEYLIKEGEQREFKPVKICLGQNMILPGIDKALIDKEDGKEYNIELKPEEAFGKRNPKYIKILSLSSFLKKGMMPQPNSFININDILAKVVSVSGGRVVVDFNNPLSDKFIVYNIKINKIITDEKEKIDTLAHFYFEKYEIKENKDEQGKNNYELIVEGKKNEKIEKKFKETLPELKISYK